MKNRISTFLIAFAAILGIISCDHSSDSPQRVPFPAGQAEAGPELAARLDKNLSRLQDSIYRPPFVYEDKHWPGDFVGRTILGLTLESEALHSQVPLLKEIVDSLPLYFNAKGYLGPDCAPDIDEQQLSGHGWLLRGLCEYYRSTGDRKVLEMVRNIADSLFVPCLGQVPSYPISPDQRSNEDGEASGDINSKVGPWMLSSDIGCIFIGMAGLVDAYEFVPSEPLRQTIDSMIERYLQMDLTGVKAQTHATLSALRALLKYSALTGREDLVQEVIDRWKIYEQYGMTCCYGNYNWFGRPDSWTEPCAIVDSYMVAFELWRITGEPQYRNIAELIEINALGHAQRSNGGFGCDSCPSSDDPYLKIVIPEAYWCCTMRGAEGLARIAQYSWVSDGSRLYVPFYRNGRLVTGTLDIEQDTEYPENGSVSLKFNKVKGVRSLMLPDLPWMEDIRVTLNGEPVQLQQEEGFLRLDARFKGGDEVCIEFGLAEREDEWGGCHRHFRGPVMLGERDGSLEPVRNLMQYQRTDNIKVLF